MSVFQLIRTERSFRWLWLSQVVSEFGDWFQFVALVSMFPTRGRGAEIVAALVVARHVVAAAVGPLAGVFADRYARAHVMIAADIARVFIALAFLLVGGPEDLVLIFVLSLLLEAFSMIFEPAKGAAIPQVLPKTKLFAANKLEGATWSAMLGIGSAAGGAVAALVGRRGAFAINAMTFALSALAVALARVPALPIRHQSSPRESAALQFAEGLRYVRDHAAQRSLLLLKPGAMIAGGMVVLVSVYADRVFAGDNALTMGALLGARGAGALIVPFIVGRFSGSGVKALSRAMIACFCVACLAFVGFANTHSVEAAALALFVAHGAVSTIWVSSSQLMQVTIPNRVFGRVIAIERAAVTLVVAVVSVALGTAFGRGFAPRTVALGFASLFIIPLVLWSRATRLHRATLEAASNHP